MTPHQAQASAFTLAQGRRVVLAGLAILPLCVPASAQGSWSEEFDRPGVYYRVFALAEFQGELVAGGKGMEGDGVLSFGPAARFDGTHWTMLGKGLAGEQVRSFTIYQNSLVAGGDFYAAGGKSANNIARWDGAQWSALGAGVDGIVYGMTEYQGDLIVTGEFDTAGGVPAKNIARWDGTQWHALGSGLDAAHEPLGLELAVGPNDELHVTGHFTSAGGASVNNIAVWNGSSWSTLGTGLPGPNGSLLWDLAWYQGQLYVCGNYDLIPGGSNHNKVAVWNGATWQSAGIFPPSAIGSAVHTLSVQGPYLFAGGLFGSVIGPSGSIPVDAFARFDGSSWSFAGGVESDGYPPAIYDSIVVADKLAVGGEFSQAGMVDAPGANHVAKCVAAFDGADWESVGTGLGLNKIVLDTVLWNGKPVAVGKFWEAGGQHVAGPVMLEGSDWVWLGHFGGHARAVTVFEGDLVAVGDFASIDQTPINGVARFDGTQWTGFGAGVPDGSAVAVYKDELYVASLYGPVKRWTGTTWEEFGPTIGLVEEMHVHNGVLYMGGSFSYAGNLVSWDGSVQQAVGGGTNGKVKGLTSFEGELVVGGEFTEAGGVPAYRLARWDGTTFTAFPGLTGTSVDELTVFRDELYAGGNLFMPGDPPKKYISRWDGSTWKPLESGILGFVTGLVPDEVRGHLYVSGEMGQAGGHPSWNMARWEVDPEDIGTIYCSPAMTNSTGMPAALFATGSAVATDNEVHLDVLQLPPGQFGYFLMSSTQDSIPVGAGVLCLGAPQFRFKDFVLNSGTQGMVTFQPDLLDPPSGGPVQSGETWNFQLWYRDGPLSNFSDAVSITFL